MDWRSFCTGVANTNNVVVYLKRRADLAQPTVFACWPGQHRALAEKLPGLRRYF
jgi:hypothetical protein